MLLLLQIQELLETHQVFQLYHLRVVDKEVLILLDLVVHQVVEVLILIREVQEIHLQLVHLKDQMVVMVLVLVDHLMVEAAVEEQLLSE